MKQITTINSIRQIPSKKWDALADGSVFASHGWLLTIEESLLKKVTPIYFLYQENGRLSGAAVCYPASKNVKIFSPDNLLFGRLKKFINPLRVSFLPTLICGIPKAYGNHILLAKNTDQCLKERIVAKILDEIETESKKRNLSLSFPRVLKNEKKLIKQLLKRGYFKTIDLPQAFMDISWDSFDTYLKFIQHRSHNMKKNIVKEINKNQKSGVTIDILKDLNSHKKRFYTLLNKNSLKHNKIPLPFHENFLSQLEKNLGDDLTIYHSRKKNQISGVGIILKKEETGCLPFIGIDYTLAQNDATFFNMLFYRPITDAISQNIRRLYYGNAMYDMKIRRGCKIEKAFFFHKPRHLLSTPAVRVWFHLHRFWYQKKLPQPQETPGLSK